MCLSCAHFCCRSERAFGCGCEDCPDPGCWPDDRDLDVDRAADNDNEPDGLPLAARRFTCEPCAPERAHGL